MVRLGSGYVRVTSGSHLREGGGERVSGRTPPASGPHWSVRLDSGDTDTTREETVDHRLGTLTTSETETESPTGAPGKVQ